MISYDSCDMLTPDACLPRCLACFGSLVDMSLGSILVWSTPQAAVGHALAKPLAVSTRMHPPALHLSTSYLLENLPLAQNSSSTPPVE